VDAITLLMSGIPYLI